MHPVRLCPSARKYLPITAPNDDSPHAFKTAHDSFNRYIPYFRYTRAIDTIATHL